MIFLSFSKKFFEKLHVRVQQKGFFRLLVKGVFHSTPKGHGNGATKAYVIRRMKGEAMNAVSIKDFIMSFVRGGNIKDAAIDAGIEPSRAGRDGLRLFARPSVRKQIEKERGDIYANGSDIRAGLERLAYGRVNDAAALVFADEPDADMIARADLFNVSELKKVKGGGVEVKFFDRQKALERLCELDASEQGDRKVQSIVEMIYGGEPEDEDGGACDE